MSMFWKGFVEGLAAPMTFFADLAHRPFFPTAKSEPEMLKDDFIFLLETAIVEEGTVANVAWCPYSSVFIAALDEIMRDRVGLSR
jgi:hypothetical protein